MTAYRITLADGTVSEHRTHVPAESVMDTARFANSEGVRIKRLDIFDADTYDRWPTADEQPDHS